MSDLGPKHIVLHREAPGDDWQVDSVYYFVEEAKLRIRDIFVDHPTWEIVIAQMSWYLSQGSVEDSWESET